jgi:hypothetical protein
VPGKRPLVHRGWRLQRPKPIAAPLADVQGDYYPQNCDYRRKREAVGRHQEVEWDNVHDHRRDQQSERDVAVEQQQNPANHKVNWVRNLAKMDDKRCLDDACRLVKCDMKHLLR